MLFSAGDYKPVPGVEGDIEVVCCNYFHTVGGVDVQEALVVCAFAGGSDCRA
jgi:hypothetical protein